MDSEPGVVRAVKITNAKVDGKLEVDPDLIAASSDTLCYSGETIKIKITGRMRYRFNGSNEDWAMRFQKSFEEDRLLHYYPELKRNHILKEKELQVQAQSVFDVAKNEGPLTSKMEGRRSIRTASKESIGSNVRAKAGENVKKDSCVMSTLLSEPQKPSGKYTFGEPFESDKRIIKFEHAPVSSTCPSVVSIESHSDSSCRGVKLNECSLSGSGGNTNLNSTFTDFPRATSAAYDLYPSTNLSYHQQVKFRPKRAVKHIQTMMDQSPDTPIEGFQEINCHAFPLDGQEAVSASESDNDPTIVTEFFDEDAVVSLQRNILGQYEGDAKDSMLAVLTRYTGLSYVRNPYNDSNWSAALPSDTLLGVWDILEGFSAAYRVLPHGKGKLSTTDDKVIYVGDFKNGKRSGFGTALIVDISQDPHHGIGYYQGNWMSNCRHGPGSLKLISGMRYEGNWYLDKPHGRGMLIYPDGSILRGHFAGGLNEGGFVYHSSDGYIELQDYKGGCLLTSRPFRKAPENTDSAHDETLNKCEPLSESIEEFKGMPSRENAPSNNDEQLDNRGSTEDANSEASNEHGDFDLKEANDIVDIKNSVQPLTKERTLTVKINSRKEDGISTSSEINLDSLLEKLLHTVQRENEFFIKHMISKVNIHCQEMLFGAQKELCEITERQAKRGSMHALMNVKNIEKKMDQLTEKFDGILNICRSVLDRQEETEKRISALDIHIAEMYDNGTIKSLQDDLKKKDEEISAAESAMNCQVCQERPRDCVLMPCMHMHTCFTCIDKIRGPHGISPKCPICRASVQGEIRLKLT